MVNRNHIFLLNLIFLLKHENRYSDDSSRTVMDEIDRLHVFRGFVYETNAKGFGNEIDVERKVASR